jgi:hypothetical protein
VEADEPQHLNRDPGCGADFLPVHPRRKTVADGMEKIGVSGETYDKMAEDWVNANETIWRGWLK